MRNTLNTKQTFSNHQYQRLSFQETRDLISNMEQKIDWYFQDLNELIKSQAIKN